MQNAPLRAPAGSARHPRRGGGSKARLFIRTGLLTGLLLALSGCSTKDIPNFGMIDPITRQGEPVLALWKGAWLAAWIVGILVWGLMGWCIVAYRKRSDELPPQVHYNLPIEILYTVVPCVVIGVLFYFTAIDENREDKVVKNPAMKVDVVGYQWAWQFGYTGGPANALGIHGRVGQFPQLVVPIGERIEFDLSSPDVIHAFWVPQVDFKRDVIPGRTNKYDLTFTRLGTFKGRCTELCGVDHDRMLFTLKTVTPADFKIWAAQTIATAKQPDNGNLFTYNGVAVTRAVPFARSRS